MKKKTQTVYRIGYVFEDGTENCITVTSNPEGVEELVTEIWKEYGEKPVVRKGRMKV